MSNSALHPCYIYTNLQFKSLHIIKSKFPAQTAHQGNIDVLAISIADVIYQMHLNGTQHLPAYSGFYPNVHYAFIAFAADTCINFIYTV